MGFWCFPNVSAKVSYLRCSSVPPNEHDMHAVNGPVIEAIRTVKQTGRVDVRGYLDPSTKRTVEELNRDMENGMDPETLLDKYGRLYTTNKESLKTLLSELTEMKR